MGGRAELTGTSRGVWGWVGGYGRGHVGGRGACRGGGADGWMDQEREKTIDREV